MNCPTCFLEVRLSHKHLFMTSIFGHLLVAKIWPPYQMARMAHFDAEQRATQPATAVTNYIECRQMGGQALAQNTNGPYAALSDIFGIRPSPSNSSQVSQRQLTPGLPFENFPISHHKAIRLLHCFIKF